MRITPSRSMRLAGRHLPEGVPADVPEAEAQLALRHGWAVAVPDGKAPRRKAEAEQPQEGGDAPAVQE